MKKEKLNTNSNLGNFPKQSKKEVFQLDTSEPTIYDNDDDEDEEFSPEQVFGKYPKTPEGRKSFIQDSLKRRKLPRSVNVPEFLKSKEIKDDGFQVIHLPKQKDKTLEIVNGTLAGMIIILTSPVIIISTIWAGIKWIFTFHYSLSNEAKQILVTRKYLHNNKNYRYESNRKNGI